MNKELNTNDSGNYAINDYMAPKQKSEGEKSLPLLKSKLLSKLEDRRRG